MKSVSKNLLLAGLAIALVAVAVAPASASLSITVDPAKNWIGYMNVFNLPVGSGGYVYGSPWGTADLAAAFTGSQLKLSPNVSQWAPGDEFWVLNGEGNKWMNANMYVEDSALLGEEVTFSGHTLANTLASGYTSQAFIKVLDPAQGWATVAQAYAPLVGGVDFSVTLNVPGTAGLVPQYGFVTDGVNANPAVVEALGYALVAPIPEPTTLVLGLGLLGGLALRRRR